MLQTERLKLYVASREEMERLIAQEPDAEMKAAYTEMLDGCLTHPEQWAWYAVWMIVKPDGTYVGDLCIKGLESFGPVEIGYGVAPQFEGRGYTTEAVTAVVDWALNQPGVVCVEAETDPDNRASQRVLAKCGFVPTGTTGAEGPRFVRRKK